MKNFSAVGESLIRNWVWMVTYSLLYYQDSMYKGLSCGW